MAEETFEFVTRLGTKSQIVLRKDIREALGLKPGSMVRLRKMDHRIELRAVKKEELIAEVDRIAEMVSKKIPHGRTSVDIIREQRD